jgi:hypothetical protein
MFDPDRYQTIAENVAAQQDQHRDLRQHWLSCSANAKWMRQGRIGWWYVPFLAVTGATYAACLIGWVIEARRRLMFLVRARCRTVDLPTAP